MMEVKKGKGESQSALSEILITPSGHLAAQS